MSFTIKVPVTFTCDKSGCDKTVYDFVTSLKLITDSETDSYGRTTTYTILTPSELPPNWSERIFYGSVSHRCEEHPE